MNIINSQFIIFVYDVTAREKNRFYMINQIFFVIEMILYCFRQIYVWQIEEEVIEIKASLFAPLPLKIIKLISVNRKIKKFVSFYIFI